MLRSLNGDRVPARGVPPARRPNRIRLRRPGDVGIGLALVENGYRVFFTGTTDLVQRMQVARRELALESLFARLDRYHLLILDDLAYGRPVTVVSDIG